MLKTVTIQIGNSDDKLTQKDWSIFIETISKGISMFSGIVHFSGGSSSDKPWQNYCWVFELDTDPLVTQSFQKQLEDLRIRARQESIAWTEGKTDFI